MSSNMSDFDEEAMPYLPRELQIRILSHIDEPDFLWTTCRRVSPEFKQWSEELFARNFLPRLKLAVQANSRECKEFPSPRGVEHCYERTDFQFTFVSPIKGDPTRALLRHVGFPYSRKTSRDNPNAGRTFERGPEYFHLLASPDFAVACQVMAEADVGLRPGDQTFVCPCRSLRASVTRGFCDRYIGAEMFFAWNAEDGVLEMQWIAFLNYVHGRSCQSRVKV